VSLPSTSRTALRSALAPSMTTSTPCSTSRPHSTRLASRVVATVAFLVEPSQSPSGCLTPSVSIPSATTQQRPLSSIPSSISTATRRSSSRRLISSIRCSRVRETNSRETADLVVERASSSMSLPRGSPVRACVGSWLACGRHTLSVNGGPSGYSDSLSTRVGFAVDRSIHTPSRLLISRAVHVSTGELDLAVRRGGR
jgi:hypothetical protein